MAADKPLNADIETPGTDPVVVEASDGVARVTLNRPKSINALSEEMLAALQSAFDGIGRDRTVRAVVLRSAGRDFCAGHDLKQLTARRADSDRGQAYFGQIFAQCSKMMTTIVGLPQPVIAEVRGVATAAGCQLVASCDLAVAADTARFGTSGVNIGLFCSTPMVALSRCISRKHAMEMLVLGDLIPASRACEFGLINKAVPDAQLEQTVRTMAAAIAGKSGAAVKLGKEAFYRQAEMDLDAAYEYTGSVMAKNMMARDAEQGIGAFVAKEPMPAWSGQ